MKKCLTFMVVCIRFSVQVSQTTELLNLKISHANAGIKNWILNI